MTVRRRIVGIIVACALGSIAIDAQGPSQPDRRGFRALSAQEAAGFSAPAGVRLVTSGRIGPGATIVAERYRQYVGDAEVLGGQLTVYRDETGARTAVIGAHYPGLAAVNTIRVTAGAAQAVAAARRGGTGGEWRTTLMIHPDTARYFYRVELRAFDARWFSWIDADTGALLNEYDGLTSGYGTGVLGDTKDLAGLTTPGTNGSYRMVSADGRQTTYDARNKNALPGTLATDGDDAWTTAGSTSPGQGALVDAQYYAKVTDSYFLAAHGFDWLDSYSQGMVSSAHARRNYNNAFWNGVQMVYGDGDGSSFIEFSGDLDVVGHELSHGVTEATSDLIYQGESGALNEAFSDIMGTAVEFGYGTGNWTVGEDITPGTNGLRNMANPNEDGDPSHYADRYTGTGDNGGVHINSGIANHWFYLLVNGGQNANPGRASGTGVTGIGLANTEAIAFLGFTALPATANFCAARASTVAVGGAFAAQVGDAWDEVGVTEALCGGGGGNPGGEALAISAVSSAKSKGGRFTISWTTSVPADSVVTFTCCGSYSSAELVTSHSMPFRGTVGATYEYFVASTDAEGHTATAGPFVHQN